MVWLTETSSSVIYDSIEDVTTIHGHGGFSEVVFDDTVEALNTEISALESELQQIAGELDQSNEQLAELQYRMDDFNR